MADEIRRNTKEEEVSISLLDEDRNSRKNQVRVFKTMPSFDDTVSLLRSRLVTLSSYLLNRKGKLSSCLGISKMAVFRIMLVRQHFLQSNAIIRWQWWTGGAGGVRTHDSQELLRVMFYLYNYMYFPIKFGLFHTSQSVFQ